MVHKAMLAAGKLKNQGVSVGVVNVSTLKPLNEETIKNLAQGMKSVVTAEEHSAVGGLASVITYILHAHGNNRRCSRYPAILRT